MMRISALENVHFKGLFGDYEHKSEKDLLKISENKNLLIIQIVKYKNSLISLENLKIDNIGLKNEALIVSNNNDTRILWNGPNNWILVSSKKKLLKEVLEKFDENNSIKFATRKNRKINLTEYYDLIYEYKNDCLTAGVRWNKKYYSDTDLKPVEELYFSITIVPLGTFTPEGISRTRDGT